LTSGGTASISSATFNQGFAVQQISLTLKGATLAFVDQTTYLDHSGRANQQLSYTFNRAP
jgi:hypothetical protein